MLNTKCGENKPCLTSSFRHAHQAHRVPRGAHLRIPREETTCTRTRTLSFSLHSPCVCSAIQTTENVEWKEGRRMNSEIALERQVEFWSKNGVKDRPKEFESSMVVGFLLPEINNSYRGKGYFGSQVQGFQAIVTWSCGSTLHHGGSTWQKRSVFCWQLGSKERDRKGPSGVPISPSRAHSNDLTSSC